MGEIASNILNEQDVSQKMEFIYYLKKKTGIFFDNTVIVKTTLAELFVDTMNIKEIDKNLLLTTCLLYACQKKDEPQTLNELHSYAKKSADFLKQLGFSDEFCRVCMQHNRYNDTGIRTKEGDILELVEQFGGMILQRPERQAYTVEEAICLLEDRNLKDTENQYLKQFVQFVKEMEEVKL